MRWLVAGLVALALVAACTAAPQPSPTPEVVDIVVPLGTQARLERGERVAIMPSVLEFRVGDTLRIDNKDIVDQAVGPFVVSAGEVLEVRFGAPGRYEGFCVLSEGESYEFVVTE
jgi:hypothetical protein